MTLSTESRGTRRRSGFPSTAIIAQARGLENSDFEATSLLVHCWGVSAGVDDDGGECGLLYLGAAGGFAGANGHPEAPRERTKGTQEGTRSAPKCTRK